MADRSAARNWCALSPKGSCSGSEVTAGGGDTPGLGGEKPAGPADCGMELGGVGVSELEVYMLGVGEQEGLRLLLGFILFSFWRLKFRIFCLNLDF